MIHLDVTKTAAAGHRSGLTRLTSRIAQSLGADAIPVAWRSGGWHRTDSGAPAELRRDDWLLTAELFSRAERPGWGEMLQARPCRLAAIFHDAIPLRLPQVTWPRSVQRHPEYLKLLAEFDRVLAISEASRSDLLGFWKWQEIVQVPPVDTLKLGADSSADEPRVTEPRSVTPGREPELICLGILEPRKNQEFLLEVCDQLWSEGLVFRLHLVGRVNPHFGRPIVSRIRKLQRRHPGLQYDGPLGDAEVRRLFAVARASVFPTRAEGCGLPLLESLWRGVPCVHSDLPVLHENATDGGCVAVPLGDHAAWAAELRGILTDDARVDQLRTEACSRSLPTWAETANEIREILGER